MSSYNFDKAYAGSVARMHRERKDLTQGQVAEALCVETSTITKFETGHGGSLYLVAAIAEFLGFSLDEIIPNRTNKRMLECFNATSNLSDEEFSIFLGAGRGGVRGYQEALRANT